MLAVLGALFANGLITVLKLMAAALLADLFGKDAAQRATTRAELEVHEDPSWDPFAKIYGLTESAALLGRTQTTRRLSAA